MAVRLGRYLGYTASVWHEILTWYGYTSTGVVSEFQSAFSWEDTFSNLLGSDIGKQAITDPTQAYNEAVTTILNQKLADMGVRSAKTARQAAKAVRGRWYSLKMPPFVNMMGRNLDIGLGDGMVTPWTIPLPGAGPRPEVQSYPVPTLDSLSDTLFSVRLEIEPHVKSGKKILAVVNQGQASVRTRIDPQRDFATIMSAITREAQQRKMCMSPQLGTLTKPAG